jgi:hypothetical protein
MRTRAASSTGRAFGLDLEASFDVPGLQGGADSDRSRPAVLELTRPDAIERAWPPTPSGVISEWWHSDGRLRARFDHHETLGYRIYAEEYGRYLVSPDGSRIRCAPPHVAAWRWQRYLIGQALPLAAVLQGLEVFHASAVSLGDRVVAFAGGTRAGKTSVALSLMLRGDARLVTDDVLVLEPGDEPVVHPGAGVLSVRHAEARSILDGAVDGIGPVLGDDGEALRVVAPTDRRALPLGALYLLQRSNAPTPSLERIRPPDFRLLLGATFNFYVRTPSRLQRQLDVCARMANAVPVFWLRLPATASAAAVAALLGSHEMQVSP